METYSFFASNLGVDCIATQPDQVARVKEFLAETISKLNELQREIDQVKAHYDSLVEKHIELSRYIKQYEALIAPIHRLPVEVLQEIFLALSPHDPQRGDQLRRVSDPSHSHMQQLASHCS